MSRLQGIRTAVRRVRRAWLLREAALRVAAGATGAAAALLAVRPVDWTLGVAAHGVAVYGGLALCVVALGDLAYRVARPPSLATVALMIERRVGAYRDSLLTALEAGPLAEASADYALRVSTAVGPLDEERLAPGWRPVVTACLCAVLFACVGASRSGPRDRGADDDVRTVAQREATSDRRAVEVIGLPVEHATGREPHLVEVVVGDPRRVRVPTSRESTVAGDILLGAPAGLELAVELFVAGETAGVPDAALPDDE